MSARTLPDVLILPVTLIPGLFFPYPFVLVAELAFTSDEGWSMENFREGVSYWKFPISMRNTLLLAAIVVPIQLSLPLLMVTMFGRMGKGRDLVLLYGPSRRASWTLPPASSGWRSSSGRAFSTP